nr:hypothetical protein [Candidatus Sigynarchaeota archaeon]
MNEINERAAFCPTCFEKVKKEKENPAKLWKDSTPSSAMAPDHGAKLDQPEDLLKSINALHQSAKEAITRRDLGQAETYLSSEVEQYTKAVEMFNRLGVPATAEKVRTKQREVGDILYAVRSERFSQEYDALYQSFEAAKTKEEFSEIQSILSIMKESIASRLNLAETTKHSQDAEKFRILLRDVESQIMYNNFFVQYKYHESKYNNIVATVNQGKLSRALESLNQLRSEFDKFLEKNRRKMKKKSTAADSTELSKIHQANQSLLQAMETLKAQIQGQYDRMIDATTSDKLSVTTLVADIIAPHLMTSDKEKESADFLAMLDKQFDAWDKGEKEKKDKI